LGKMLGKIPAGTPAANRRVHFVDEMRGLMIILVVSYHALYDLVLFSVVPDYAIFNPWTNAVRDVMVAVLVLISGISCLYSRSNFRRGLKTFAFGMIITAVTRLIIPGQLILFGILHFFGTAMMLFALIRPLAERIPAFWGTAVSVLLAVITRELYSGYIGFFGAARMRLPEIFFEKPWLFPLGFPNYAIFSADYYPLMPWFFIFMAGSFLGRYIKSGKVPEYFYRQRAPLLSVIGRHTMLIYLLHQPIIYAAVWLLSRFLEK